jgi:hypothetical protein
VNFSGARLDSKRLRDVHLEGSEIVATMGHRNRITICHVPPGNSQARRTITVSYAAVEAHLAHGDTLGPCDSDDDGDGDNDGDDSTRVVRGIGLVGATFTAVSNTDAPLTLRISSVTPPSGSSDIWHYTVEYRETDDQYYPICYEVASNINHAAIPINGW